MTSAIIRTSDRSQFRRCRQKWDFTSKIRQDWEYVPGVEPLDFGIGIHAGADTYYKPETWRGTAAQRRVVEYESTLSFLTHMHDWRKRLKRSEQWESQKARWEELVVLGLGMLEHYFKWAPKNDKFKPVKSEIEFEVPIPVPESLKKQVQSLQYFTISDKGNLLWKPDGSDEWPTIVIPVMYQGRIDLIVQFVNGSYGILDHKTAAQFGQTEHLDLDTQTRSYAWALKKMLGLDISTIIYSEWRKAIPHEPDVLKNGSLSKNKNQRTTVEMYRKAIEERGLDISDYVEFLSALQANQTDYFRRTEVSYSEHELAATEEAICMEAIDMLGDPFIYPNPDRWNCNGCAFRTPCIMRQEGNDEQWHLNNSSFYVKRSQLVEVSN